MGDPRRGAEVLGDDVLKNFNALNDRVWRQQNSTPSPSSKSQCTRPVHHDALLAKRPFARDGPCAGARAPRLSRFIAIGHESGCSPN